MTNQNKTPQIQTQQIKWKPNIYFSQDIGHSGFSELSINKLVEHVKEALEEAEAIISKGFPSMSEAKKIIEEKVKDKLERYQDIEYVEYWFDEGVEWDMIEVGNAYVSRVYDAIDWLTIAIVDGPEILFDVHADYVVVEGKGDEHVVYFKINEVVLNSVRW
jgi:hypothetical protein